MFTGIVEEKGMIDEIRVGSQAGKLTVKAKKVLADVKLGDSISVNGVCLTVTHFSGDRFTADVMPETLKKTNLGHLARGAAVNLERAMKLGDRFGGHIVSGHVDGTGRIISRERYANAFLFHIEADAGLRMYMVPRGSVCVDGISLTIVDVTDNGFSISVIPHTLAETNLGNKQTGDWVNLECDIISKYVERLLTGQAHQQPGSSSTKLGMDYLTEHGFA